MRKLGAAQGCGGSLEILPLREEEGTVNTWAVSLSICGCGHGSVDVRRRRGKGLIGNISTFFDGLVDSISLFRNFPEFFFFFFWNKQTFLGSNRTNALATNHQFTLPISTPVRKFINALNSLFNEIPNFNRKITKKNPIFIIIMFFFPMSSKFFVLILIQSIRLILILVSIDNF